MLPRLRANPGEKRERVRVLAVDDDPNDLRYIRDTLVESGYAPVVTGDPEEAVRLMAEERPELALLALLLPGTDGIELMQDILAVADVPVIFLSAYGREEVIARAFEMGAVDYVVKPFSPTELAVRIGAALRSAGDRRAVGTLRAGRPDHRLRPATGDPVRRAGASDAYGVRSAGRAVGQRRAGANSRTPARTGLGGAG